ncbi:trypsin-like peptidase domain-containing protein [Aliidiomarina celeris]|uniref:trypsin-like peptidase domain-containing protein n=1 Tax=Aliidiomarina celeris TaxID=2249428 RepID=UPI000DEA67E4|nr:trypsin-like peptidase domain-containing protein [Aliidiomarina celeris]
MAQYRSSPLTQYFIKPVILGLIVAVIVLVAMPLFAPQHTPTNQLSSAPVSYADAVERAAPAVVNIYTEQSVRDSRRPWQQRSQVVLGSGVIMNSDGYILTANHVVSSVDEVRVALQDGRLFIAQLVGRDELTDLAVLRIDADNLPVIPRNLNYNPRVGDVVLAIGNPYNLGQTVTQGIVSATGKTSLGSGYSEFVQTDASINEGNSGGALINTRGELVGINSAQYLAEQGSTGIHFSVAYRVAQRVMEQIISEGVVTRGYLGVVAEQNYQSQFQDTGIFLREVERGGPADKAGLRAGDFIYRINGTDIATVGQGLDLVADTPPGVTLTIDFIRNNQRLSTEALIEPWRPER